MAATLTKLKDSSTLVAFLATSSNVGASNITDEILVDVSSLNGATTNTRFVVTKVEYSCDLPILLEFDLTTDQMLWGLKPGKGTLDFEKFRGVRPLNNSGTGDLVMTHAGVEGARYSLLIEGYKVEMA